MIINHIKLYDVNIVVERILSKLELLFSVCGYDYFTKFILGIHLLPDTFTHCEA